MRLELEHDDFQEVTRLTEPTAAVAVIRCADPVESVLLVRRARNRKDPWSGHFAFPGGRREAKDPSIFATCTREVAEETGIELQEDLLVKVLPITPAGRRIHAPVLVQPYLFEVPYRPPVRPAVLEIDTYVWLEAASFGNKRNHIETEVAPGITHQVYPLADYYIWGFTYGILCTLFAVRRKPGGNNAANGR